MPIELTMIMTSLKILYHIDGNGNEKVVDRKVKTTSKKFDQIIGSQNMPLLANMDIPLSYILSRPYQNIGLKDAITDQPSDSREGSYSPSKCNVSGA